MAAFVPTVAAPGCSWTPAARAVCATRPLGTGAPAARHPTRRVRAGRVTVTAAAKPLDVTADTFDVEVMQSVRFAVMQGHCASVVLAGSGVCFVRAHWKRVCARPPAPFGGGVRVACGRAIASRRWVSLSGDSECRLGLDARRTISVASGVAACSHAAWARRPLCWLWRIVYGGMPLLHALPVLA